MSSAPGDPAETAPRTTPAREPTPAELAAQQGVPARGASHYAKGSAANMARSMAVIVAITLALFFMTGRPNSTTPQSVDVPGSDQYRAQQAGQGWLLISRSDRVVLFNCATGLKYPMPPADKPLVAMLRDFL
mgnify:CR=1 FL=1